MRPFHLGWNMNGGVSAGAYTAGVVDFLMDALDTLYRAREAQRAKYGEDYSRWEIPALEARLAVLSGASGGGMTSALTAAALCEDFTPMRGTPAAGAAANRLYKSWVQDIDIAFLLGKDDFLRGNNQVQSLLDATRIDRIAAEGLALRNPRPAPRPWVREDLKVILTLTDVRGVPYTIEKDPGGLESQTNYHADQQRFQMAWNGRRPAGTIALPLDPHTPANWDLLREAAKATGAFPVILPARILKRDAGDYNDKEWRISADHPECKDGVGQCELFEKQPPYWTLQAGDRYLSVNVDGGVTNNSPFECARRELALLDPAPNGGRCARSGRDADRAVITIAPLPASAHYDPQFQPDTSLFAIGIGVLTAMLTQSRIQGEELKLTPDPDVFSRFVIAPSLDNPRAMALAGSALGAFAGFLAREFRDHDYQLGRRNCQQLLRRHLVLPLDNVLLRQYTPNAETLARYTVKAQNGEGQTFDALPIVPLMEELRTEIRVENARIPRARLNGIVDQAAERLKLVIENLIASNHLGWLPKAEFEVAWLFVHAALKTKLEGVLEDQLNRQDLLQ